MLTPKQAAARVGISTSLIYQWCKEGLLEHFRIGAKGKRSKVLIPPEEIDRFLESCKQKPAKPLATLRHITALKRSINPVR